MVAGFLRLVLVVVVALLVYDLLVKPLTANIKLF